jgi:hypothetical protein|tara:strand:- start:598 stop:720 length:123 start_codon:yes stop_codon:yes gene_type:complete
MKKKTTARVIGISAIVIGLIAGFFRFFCLSRYTPLIYAFE